MDDCEELIERLLALAGMWLEDASAMALIKDKGLPAERYRALGAVAGDVQVILAAAEVIHLKCIGSPSTSQADV